MTPHTPQVGPQVGEVRMCPIRDVPLTLQDVSEGGVAHYTREGTFRGPINTEYPCLYSGFTALKEWASWPLVQPKPQGDLSQ